VLRRWHTPHATRLRRLCRAGLPGRPEKAAWHVLRGRRGV